MALRIIRVRCTPGFHPCNGFGTPVIVTVLWLGEPFHLTRALAGKPARCRRAVPLMPLVAGFRRKTRPAMHTLALFRLRHFALLAGSQSRHRLNTRRRPKKTPNNEKKPTPYMTNSKTRKANFTPANFDQFQVGRDKSSLSSRPFRLLRSSATPVARTDHWSR